MIGIVCPQEEDPIAKDAGASVLLGYDVVGQVLELFREPRASAIPPHDKRHSRLRPARGAGSARGGGSGSILGPARLRHQEVSRGTR